MLLEEVEDIRFQTAGSAKGRAMLFFSSDREPVAVSGRKRLGRAVAGDPQRGVVEVF